MNREDGAGNDKQSRSVGDDFMRFVGALVSERHELPSGAALKHTARRKGPLRAGEHSRADDVTARR
jgi:hypothetical protein